jgi:anthranilate/para-aminobenzoate synthase component II
MVPKILYSAGSAIDPFRLINDVKSIYNPFDLTADGALLLHGGADISPSIYKQEPNDYCFADRKPSYRDELELAMIERARKLDIPIIGICRGAQLLCAVDGGYLIQHIHGHTDGNHSIIDTRTSEVITSNSCHHQMMAPAKDRDNIILAECRSITIGYDDYSRRNEYPSCPEIVYFPKLKAIGIQGHPEWMHGSPFVAYCCTLINEFLYAE